LPHGSLGKLAGLAKDVSHPDRRSRSWFVAVREDVVHRHREARTEDERGREARAQNVPSGENFAACLRTSKSSNDSNFSAIRCVVAVLHDRLADDAKRSRSGWLSPVHVDGDGYDGVVARRRASNKGFLEISFVEQLELLDIMALMFAEARRRS